MYLFKAFPQWILPGKQHWGMEPWLGAVEKRWTLSFKYKSVCSEWELQWRFEGDGGQLIPTEEFILMVYKLGTDGCRNGVSVANNKVWHLSED